MVSQKFLLAACLIALLDACNPATEKKETATENNGSAERWLTKADGSVLLQKETVSGAVAGEGIPELKIDTAASFQTIDGFGYTLTGGSAALIHSLPDAQRKALLDELFGTGENAIGISYLRLSIGASDLSDKVFSYADLPAGQKDTSLAGFSMTEDEKHLIPLLKEIIAIQPHIKFMGTPWSPPAWMKSNDSSKGGSLLPIYYGAYARYLVKYIDAMASNGIMIDAITPQNEPLHPGNNPSMLMLPAEQAAFIGQHLGPAFKKAGIRTKIVTYDHNCDHVDYPLMVLSDATARPYIDGAAFHLYAGDIDSIAAVQRLYPDKNLYFTEQWTGAKGTFSGDLLWHIRHVIIGSLRNGSKVALEWNLAADSKYEPHTPGGCTECKGALTIDGAVTRNVAYYIIAHASKFVPAGSVRVQSGKLDGIWQVAFKRPDNRIAVIVLNETENNRKISLRRGERKLLVDLPPSSVATYLW